MTSATTPYRLEGLDKVAYIEYYPATDKSEAMYFISLNDKTQDVFTEEDFVTLFSNNLKDSQVSLNRPDPRYYSVFDKVYIHLKEESKYVHSIFDYEELLKFLENINPLHSKLVEAHLHLQ